MNQKQFTVCGVVIKEQNVLLVRHTYGTAKGRLLLPGGYVREQELPTDAVVREILEETSIQTEVSSIISVQFKPDQWCIVFRMKYCSGKPTSDGYENNEADFFPIEDAILRNDITNMSRVILTAISEKRTADLFPGAYCPIGSNPNAYRIFGI